MCKKYFCFFLVVCVGFTVFSAPAHANSILEFFFPSLKKEEYDPTKTMKAPFAYEDPEAVAQNPSEEPPEEVDKKEFLNAVPLERPHRLDNEIGEWLMLAVSEVITFDEKSYSATMAQNRAYFDANGFAQFEKFLVEQKVKKVVDSRQFKISGFVEEIPVVLNAGNVNGSYRWLFDVPVMISYMKRGDNDYRDMQPVNQKLVLTIQVGRNLNADNEHGIFIERWSGELAEQ